MTDLSTLTQEHFAARMNQVFTIDSGDGARIEAELVEVRPLGETALKSGRRQGFSVLFRGPMEPILPQRVYTLEHPKLGEIQLFLVPIGPDGTGLRYEAVFS
jgi:hypothetical protein